MKTVAFTEFRKKASDFITEVEQGENILLLRRGKPVAEVVPFTEKEQRIPSWKQSRDRLQISGSDLTTAVLEEREAGS